MWDTLISFTLNHKKDYRNSTFASCTVVLLFLNAYRIDLRSSCLLNAKLQYTHTSPIKFIKTCTILLIFNGNSSKIFCCSSKYFCKLP